MNEEFNRRSPPTMYKERFNDIIESVYMKGVSTKILEHMNRIRNSSSVTLARRWVFELLQNARDLSDAENPVSVLIVYDGDNVYFKHNGKPFRVRDILSIINQVSSKSPGESIGQFGTGFITTYQLSEKVRISSYLKEDELPYVPFDITLDRSGRDSDIIIESVNKNIDELFEQDNGTTVSDTEYSNIDYPTVFQYHLSGDESHKVAEIGIKDLTYSLQYVMAFNPAIKSIKIVNKVDSTEVSFENAGLDGENFKIMENDTPHYIYLETRDKVTAAVEVDGEGNLLPLSKETPKLFIAFPLVGSEDFPFPIVINSEEFAPNEPRSGITLTDRSTSDQSINNKRLINIAVDLYAKLLEKYEERNVHNMIPIPAKHDNPEWSETYVNDLYKSLFEKITATVHFQTSRDGKKLISSSDKILKEKDSELLEKFCNVLNSCPNINFVDSSTVDWYTCFKNYSALKDHAFDVKDFIKDINTYYTKIDSEERMKWISDAYNLGMSKENTKELILSSEIAVVPDQNGDLQRLADLKKDPGIPDVFVEVLNSVPRSEHVTGEIKKSLINKEFTGTLPDTVYKFSTDDVIRGIKKYPQSTNRTGNNINRLIACGPDETMYNLACYGYNYYPRMTYDYAYLDMVTDYPKSMWSPIYAWYLTEICEKFRGRSYVQGVFRSIFTNKSIDDKRTLLADFYTCLDKYASERMNDRIFVSMEGCLVACKDLKRDRVENRDLFDLIDKIYSYSDVTRYKSYLPDEVAVVPDSYLTSALTDRDLAHELNAYVNNVLQKEGGVHKATSTEQEVCAMLANWLEEHADRVASLFPQFIPAEERAKLLSSRAIAKIQNDCKRYAKENAELKQKITELENTISEQNEIIGDLEAKLLNSGSSSIPYEKKQFFSDDCDVFFSGADRGSMSDDDFAQWLRMIGDKGEKVCYAMICELCSNLPGATADENAHTFTFAFPIEQDYLFPDISFISVKGASEIDVRLDHGTGYDISVKVDDAVYYVEIKTMTITSVFSGQLHLSSAQYVLANAVNEHFAAAYIRLNKELNLVESNVYPNIPKLIGDGKLVMKSQAILEIR